MPHLKAGGYLLDALIEMGLCQMTEWGFRSLPWTEIKVYCSIRGFDADEAQLLRKLSNDFVEGRIAGEDPLEFSPMEMEL